MRLRRMPIMLVAVASLGIGLAQAPASAAAAPAAARTAQALPRTPTIRHGEIRSKAVNVTVYCGQFKGSLSYWSSPVRGGEDFWWEVDGTLSAKCKGETADLRAYWTALGSEENELIGNTTGTQTISWSSPVYPGPLAGMHVELCTHGSSGGGCANSPDL